MYEIVDGEIVLSALILPIAMIVGSFLIILKPFYAFIFSIFIPLALSNTTVYFSKFIGLPYTSLSDICLGISIFAFLRSKKLKSRNASKVRTLSTALIIILLVGFFNSIFRYDHPYATLRALRWAINIPLLIVISYYMVNNQRKLKVVLATLILADVFSSFQHLFWLSSQGYTLSFARETDLLRNISFLRGQSAWLASGFFSIKGKVPLPAAQILIGIIFFIVIITQQTRSLAISLILSIVLFNIFVGVKKNKKAFTNKLLIFLLFFTLLSIILYLTGYEYIISSYISRILETRLDGSMASGTLSRINSFYTELNDWSHGNLLIGEGLFYYQKYGYGLEGVNTGNIGYIAFGHLGYVNYLSQLGIIGLLVYGFWFPISILKKSKKIMNKSSKHSSVKHLAILTFMTFLQSMISFIMSGSFIGPYLLIPGILAGCIYSADDFLDNEVKPLN